MIETWRWFGPLDKITLMEIAQTGTSGIVTALHEIPYGEIWPVRQIVERQKMIAKSKMFEWMVVESLPVDERIKIGEGNLDLLFANYRQSMANLSECGISTICYNFMPLLDWTRTNLNSPLPGGGTALRFDTIEMAVFDIFILKRKGASNQHSPSAIEKAEKKFRTMRKCEKERLLASIMAGLPGAYRRYSIPELRDALNCYNGIDKATLKSNFRRFLKEVMPTAAELGIRLCIHPDDPPQDILGLPRIVSTESDIDWIMSEENYFCNGLTLCSGSLGAHWNNNILDIARRFSHRVHFAHLRNIIKEFDGSFQESSHLQGDLDMVSLIEILLKEEKFRQEAGCKYYQIPFRPDHGHDLLSDTQRGTHPGYPLIGRMRGLAELRGVTHALSYREDLTVKA